MKIILMKSAEVRGKKFPIGQKMDVTPEVFESLGDAAKEISGPMVTGKKAKTDLFKPKDKKVSNEIAQTTNE
jgi:hypothetical protein